MGTLLRDLHYALSQIRRRPLLYGGVILSLALGIGANTTIFSYSDAVLLRMPPVSHPETLAEVYTHNTDVNASYGGFYPMSYLDWKDIRVQNHSFDDIAIYDPMASVTMNRGERRATWNGQLVSGNYFSVLGVEPALGRGFLPHEADTVGSAAVVVLSYNTWQEQFGGDRNILGQKVLLNQLPYLVVGVAPAGFDGLMAGFNVNFWAPVTMAEHAGSAGWLVRGSRVMFGVGRLKAGTTLAQATADLTVVQKHLDATYPNDDKPYMLGLATQLLSEPAMFRSSLAGANLLLMAIVGLVLLIACFNAANLLLVQSYTRHKEWAVRAALGASRARLLRQGLTESLLLAVIAGALGLEFARIAAPLMLQLKPPGFPVALQFSLDWRLTLFAAAVALGTGILFGMAPAWHAARAQAAPGLRETAGSGERHRLRHGLIAAQVGMCMVILVGAGLCLRSLQHADAINPGFDTDHMVTAMIDTPGMGYSGAPAQAYADHLVDHLQAEPGVRAVAMASVMPLGFISGQREALAEGMQPPPGKHGISVDIGVVGPGYFAATGTRLLEGRDFQRSDLRAFNTDLNQGQIVPTNPDFVVVNEALARAFWPHQDPVGRQLLLPHGDTMGRAQVLAVAENGKYRSLGEATRMYLYMLAPVSSGTLIVRTIPPAAQAEASLRAQLYQLDPNLTSAGVQTARDAMTVLLFPVHATSMVLIGFGSLALLLALVGLYGVVAGSVAQRTREFGIRMAMGAAPGQVLGEVLRQGARLAAWGVGVGLVLAALVTRAAASLLYGVSPLDPAAYLATAAVLITVALAAAYLPARRAAAVDPMAALRND